MASWCTIYENFEETKEDFSLVINNEISILCNKLNILEISSNISLIVENDPNVNEFHLTFNDFSDEKLLLIQKILKEENIIVNAENEAFLLNFSKQLGFTKLEEFVSNYELHFLIKLEETIFNLTENNFLCSYENLKTLILTSGKETICRMLINACIARPKNTMMFLKLTDSLDLNDVMSRVLLLQMETLDNVFAFKERKNQIICYLIRHYYDAGFIRKEQITRLYQNLPVFFEDLSDFNSNFIKRHGIELFKERVKEGINPNPISIFLRNDDIDSFQNFTSKDEYFDFDQKIAPSDFEQCDFVNQNCTLIQFAAFFNSIKCFKFLLLNSSKINNIERIQNAQVIQNQQNNNQQQNRVQNDFLFEDSSIQNLTQFAVAGGNSEIVRICKQNGFSFFETREVAIKFHQWDIFEWVFETIFSKILEENVFGLLYQCIQFSNFKTFLYLIEKDTDYNLALPLAVDYDNILLTQWLLKRRKNLYKLKGSKSVEKSLIHFACRNENLEMLKLLLNEKRYDVNAKYEGQTPLIITIARGNSSLFDLLLSQNKIQIDAADFSGMQPLHYACSSNNPAFLQKLLEYCNKIQNAQLHKASSKDIDKITINLSAKDKKGVFH